MCRLLSNTASRRGEYQLSVPETWREVADPPSLGNPVRMYRHPAPTRYQGLCRGAWTRLFSPALTVIEYPRGLTAGGPTSRVFHLFHQLLPSMFSGFDLRELEETSTRDGTPACRYHFGFRMGTRSVEALALLTATDHNILWVDGTALHGDLAVHRKVIEGALGSLSLSAPAESCDRPPRRGLVILQSGV